MTHRISPLRRRLIRLAGLVSLSGMPGVPTRLLAAELPHVTEDDATAVALKYKQDAATSARPSADQFCRNCRYFKGTAQTQWERCDLFPGKAVNGGGWCNVWALKG
jgi:hypothetical protein